MTEISIYQFCVMFTNAKEIIIHGWYKDENGKEACLHETFTDRFDHGIYDKFKDFAVLQFSANKKGVIEIIGGKF